MSRQEFDFDPERRSKISSLIAIGQKRGYLSYAEIYDALPDDIDPDDAGKFMNKCISIGIELRDENPGDGSLLDSDDTQSPDVDEEEAEAVAEVLATVSIDAELGRTTDPVRNVHA